MSAGAFIKSSYEADSGLCFPTRVQPETELASFGDRVNDAPSTPLTPGAPFISVRVGKRSPRLQVRYALVELTAQPTGQYADYAGIGTVHRLVVADPATFALWQKNMVGTYLGTAAIIRRLVGEVA